MAEDWFQQALSRMAALNSFRMAMLQHTQNSLGGMGMGGNAFYSPQAVAINAMQSSRNLPPVAPISPQQSNDQLMKYELPIFHKLNKLTTHLNLSAYLADKLMNEAPKTSVGKKVIDVISRGDYASANAAKALASGNAGGAGTAAWRGLSGKDKTTYAGVINQINPNAPDLVKGIGGFAGDVFLDPTTYIPFAGIASKVGGAAKLGRAARLTDAATNAAPKILEGTPVATRQAGDFVKWALSPQELDRAMAPRAIEGPQAGNRIFVGSATEAPSISAPDVLRTMKAQDITSQIQAMPKLVHPSGLSISPLFKDVTTTESKLVPVTKTVPVPETPKPVNTRLATLRAIKLSILNTPDYSIKGFKVRDILRTAKSTTDASRLKMIDEMLNAEAKRVYKTGDVTSLAKIGGKAGAKFLGREGTPADFGLTVQQSASLLGEAKVGSEGLSQAELNKLPAHVEDLSNVHVHNASGNVVSLGQYLQDLGVEVNAVTPTGELKPVNRPFQFDFEKPQPKTTTKTVLETVNTSVTKTRRLNPAETIGWMSRHAGMLSPEEMSYLRRAGSRASFEKRLAELKTKVVVGNFKTLDEVISAAEQGLIPKDALENLLKVAGAKSLKDLRSKALDILNKTGERKPPVAKPSVPKPTSKLQRITGKVPDEFATGVKPAEQLVAEGADLQKTVPQLDQVQIADLANAMGFATLENIIRPLDPKQYPWVTSIKHALRTHRTPGRGRARNIHGWNAYSQSDVFRVLVSRASRDIGRKLEATGTKAERRALQKQRASMMYDRVVPSLQAADALLRNRGVRLVAGTDNKGLLISLSDLIEALPRPLVEKYLFTPNTSVYSNALLNSAAGIAKSLIEGTSIDIAREDAYNAIRTNSHVDKMKNPDQFTGQVFKDLMDHSDSIVQKVEENYAREAMKAGTDVTSMTDEVIKRVAVDFADPNVSMGKAFGEFMTRHQQVAAIGRRINAAPGTTSMASDLVDAKLANTVSPSDIAESRGAVAQSKTPGSAKVAKDQYAARAATADAIGGDVVDIGQKYENRLHTALFKAEVPLDEKITAFKDALGEAFVPHYGHRDLHNILRDRRSVTQDLARMHSNLMSNLWDLSHRNFGANVNKALQDAFRLVQEDAPITDPKLAEIADQMKKSIDISFGSAVDGLGSYAQRNGLIPERLNRTMAYYGIKSDFWFDPKKSIVDQKDIWKNWNDVEDPLTLLDKIHASLQRASVETTIGASFSHEFGSTVPHPGLIRISDKSNSSIIAPYIDQTLYYPKEMVQQLTYLDRVLKGQFRGFKNPTINQMAKVYDSVIHSWKAGLTIYRPGHHISNLIGDITLSWFAGVNNPHVYQIAARIMGKRAASYRDWNGLKALTEGKALPDVANGTGIYIKVKGKKVFIGDDRTWREAFNKGTIPDYRTLEDVAFNLRQSQNVVTTANRLRRPFGGKLQKAAGGLSQARDHWVRIAHFVDVLQKGNWNSLEEAFNHAGDMVRKWHPDGSDLSNFEAKYMRRSFMFYSWQRKAIPLVIETLYMNPGKALVMPKAMYNFSIAMGLDPESITNPFPNDMLFPSWLQDNIYGPQWKGSIPGIPGTGTAGGTHLRGINWPDPSSQILSQYGGNNPLGEALGATSPVARVPLELAFGKNIRTGSDIMSTPEYLDSQLPGVSYFDKIFGRSLTGFGEPIRNVQRGNVQPGFNPVPLFNWSTGLGQVDYSQRNYQIGAQLELRDRLRKAAQGG